MTASGVLAEQSLAALGAGVVLLGGWIVGGVLVFRSGIRRQHQGDATPDQPLEY